MYDRNIVKLNIKTSIYLFSLILWPLAIFGQSAIPKKPFSVTFFSNKELIEKNKALSDFNMAKDTTQCRGAYMPKGGGPWDCSPFNKIIKCTRNFKCLRLNAGFNRITESKRTFQILNKYPKEKDNSYRLEKPQIHLPSFESNFVARKKIQQQQQQKKIEEKEIVVENPPDRNLKDHLPEVTPDNSGVDQDLLQFIKTEGLSFSDIDNQKDVRALLEQEIVTESIVLSEFDPLTDEDVKWSLNTNVSSDGSTKTYKLKRMNNDKLLFEGQWSPFQMALSVVQISSSQGESLLTYDAAWTPIYHYSLSWNFKGNFGGHFLTINDGVNDNSFVVYEAVAMIQYLSKTLYYEGGLGYQLWQNDAADKFLTTHLGAGFIFHSPIFKFMDRAFINYSMVNNSDANKEIKLGVGFRY